MCVCACARARRARTCACLCLYACILYSHAAQRFSDVQVTPLSCGGQMLTVSGKLMEFFIALTPPPQPSSSSASSALDSPSSATSSSSSSLPKTLAAAPPILNWGLATMTLAVSASAMHHVRRHSLSPSLPPSLRSSHCPFLPELCIKTSYSPPYLTPSHPPPPRPLLPLPSVRNLHFHPRSLPPLLQLGVSSAIFSPCLVSLHILVFKIFQLVPRNLQARSRTPNEPGLSTLAQERDAATLAPFRP